jgi:hypothetical protein
MRITARSALAVGSKRDLDAHIKYIVFLSSSTNQAGNDKL